MINKVIKIAKEASVGVMKIYQNDTFMLKIKKDSSPVTVTDIVANQIIIEGIKKDI